MLKHKGIIGAIIILLVIAFGMGVFAYLYKVSNVSSQAQNIFEDKKHYSEVQSIEAVHFYDGKTHTLVGEIELPTPCDLLSWDVSVAESYPEQVTINFSVSNHSDACVDIVTPQEFYITYEASEEAQVKTRFERRKLPVEITQGVSGENDLEFRPFLTH